ncbi:MAG: hypothetical protein C4547_14680 [Phycisphaerales bacterium]|nr:MAG: hypothetical protein C4547_14680 [Phycisphaerales bacterium]
MMRKVSPADRYRKELHEAVGAASLDFSGYCRLAAQAMLQSAMEIEVEEFVGRRPYERRGDEQATYRNGYKRRRVATGEGAVELHVPQTRDGVEPFQTVMTSLVGLPSTNYVRPARRVEPLPCGLRFGLRRRLIPRTANTAARSGCGARLHFEVQPRQ